MDFVRRDVGYGGVRHVDFVWRDVGYGGARHVDFVQRDVGYGGVRHVASVVYWLVEVSTGVSVDCTVLRLNVVWSWRVFFGDDGRLVTSCIFPQQYFVSD